MLKPIDPGRRRGIDLTVIADVADDDGIQLCEMVQAAGLSMFRFPGGSSSDTWHFNASPTYTGEGTTPSMARFIASTGGVGMVTLDYGTGSPQEGAALLAYLNGSISNPTAIGSGQEWNGTSNTWVQQDWKTAGYWASLRAASPLPQDDGLNFLRLGRSAPFAFHYFEVGNEIYGSWETDHHGAGGDTGAAHDPATYVSFAKQFAAFAALIDSTISIGQDTGSISYDNSWTSNVLHQDATQGFTPGFLSDHVYMQGPGSESDSTLLFNSVSNTTAGGSGSPFDWSIRATGYRNLLNQVLGANAAHVELLATETNSVYASPGKQSTSLVDGLYLADSIGGILKTEYNALDFWDLRNGWDTGNNNSASLYGWRQGGDYGLLGSGASAPASGTYIPYPTYFAEQLLSKMVHNGDTVVQASTDTSLDVFAVKQATGHLDMLVINKNATTDLMAQFQISGLTPYAQAQVWQYGKAQDTAQSQTTDGHAALAGSSATLALSMSNYFSYTFPSYSMTVLDVTPTLPTTTVVTGSAGACVYGQPVTFTASVTASGGTPAGSVEFYDLTSGADLGTGTLKSSASGTSTWAYTTLATQLKATGSGSDTIQAVFTPFTNFTGSSATLPGGAKVSPAPLTIAAVSFTKACDGTTSAAATPAVMGLQGTDTVVGLKETYDSSTLGTGKTLMPSGTISDGNSGNNYTVTTTVNTTGAIVPGSFSKFVVSVLTASTITAGDSIIFTVQATDQFGNPVSSYAGPTNTTVSVSPLDTQSAFPLSGTLNSTGFTFLLGNLETAGVYTLNVTAGTFSGSSSPITVMAGNPSFFLVAAPATAVTGSSIDVTVTAVDRYQNLSNGYTGTVTLTSDDPKVPTLVSSYHFSTGIGGDNGVHTFHVALQSGGNRKITATDLFASSPNIIGKSSAIATRGLIVTTVTTTGDSFTVTFDKAFLPADLALYGSTLARQADASLSSSSVLTGTGGAIGTIRGTLLIDPSNQALTFKATSSYLRLLNSLAGKDSVLLPDGIYTITLVAGSGGKGFLDSLAAGLDGLNDGTTHNYTTTFTTHFQSSSTPALALPDFARGPDDSTPLIVPNDISYGIPITLYNAVNVTDVSFTLSYNSALFHLTGAFTGASSDATDPAAGLVLGANGGGSLVV